MTVRTPPAHKRPTSTRQQSLHDSTLGQALAPIHDDLTAVRERLLVHVSDPIAQMVVYLIAAGGKRLRPALVLLTGSSGPSPQRTRLIDAAAAIELIHTATLIHDDIIDQSPVRRSQPTFHARWGTERAVLMGDYLYATAFTVLARLQAPNVMQTMAEVCQQLSRGELREVEARYRLDLSEAEYLEIIQDKTASLIGGCCRCGALLGGASPETVERLTEFGINFGLAFQIMDDCLDLVGDQRELGKSIHADLDKGALSLPVIYLAQALSPRQRQRLFAPLCAPATSRGSMRRVGTRATDPVFLARVARAAQSCGAITKARERANAFVAAAQAALAQVPINGLTSAYEQLAQYAVSRRS